MYDRMSNSLVSTIRDLGRKRGRERRGLALAEGVRLVEEALAAEVPIRGAVVGPALEATARGKSLKAALAAAAVPLHEVSSDDLAQLADTEHPQGIIAIIAPRRWNVAHITLAPRDTVLVLDAVQDPGNVGTMIRTAFALGAGAVIALSGSADLANPKVIRSTMGAIFRLPCAAAGTDEFLAWAAEQHLALWVGDTEGEPLGAAGTTPRAGRVALVVGNEGAGVSDALRQAASRRVAIPLAEGAESLSVGAAAAILLYEVLRD
jgi:TrmH family RNA methyltransferase